MKIEKKKLRIGELAVQLGVERFVIRFWEKEFGIKGQRSDGGQRSYSDNDVKRFILIKELLYSQGFTIAGAKKHLKETAQAKRLAIAQKPAEETALQAAPEQAPLEQASPEQTLSELVAPEYVAPEQASSCPVPGLAPLEQTLSEQASLEQDEISAQESEHVSYELHQEIMPETIIASSITEMELVDTVEEAVHAQIIVEQATEKHELKKSELPEDLSCQIMELQKKLMKLRELL